MQVGRCNVSEQCPNIYSPPCLASKLFLFKVHVFNWKWSLNALVQRCNKKYKKEKKEKEYILKNSWPGITVKFNEWFNSEFVFVFYFCFVPLACVFLQHFYKGFVHVSWRHEEAFCRVVKTPKLPKESAGEGEGGGDEGLMRGREGMFFVGWWW